MSHDINAADRLQALSNGVVQHLKHGGNMQLQIVTGPKFMTVCFQCGKRVQAGDGAQEYRDTAKPPVYADTEGEPWKAYYCADCAKAVQP